MNYGMLHFRWVRWLHGQMCMDHVMLRCMLEQLAFKVAKLNVAKLKKLPKNVSLATFLGC